MAIEIIATPNAANANSFGTVEEADFYFARRVPLPIPWVSGGGDSQASKLIMAQKIITSTFQPRRKLKMIGGKNYYVTSRTWTGSPTTTTQALPWGRNGMYDFNGNAISGNVIPQPLKDAQFELAGQLALGDRILDSDIETQGITHIKADTVELSFKEMVEAKVLPDAVMLLMPESWFTDEIIELAIRPSIRII
jgi:DnaT-like ssDNA binding protein